MASQSQVGAGGVRREEVKVFQSSLDRRTMNTTVLAQPSFYVGLANMVLMALTQRFPEEFIAPKYLSMSYNGIRASAMLTIPFCCISGGYFAVASVIATSPSPLAGHFLGYTLSLGVGLSMLTLRRVSWYYPLLGAGFLTYGGFHHYRRMMVYGDNAPIFYWSDFSEIRQAMKEKKAQKSSDARRQWDELASLEDEAKAPRK